MPAHALPLNLTLEATPDIVAMFVDVNYDPGTDALTANGFAAQIMLGSGPEAITDGGGGFGGFNLAATVDGAGAQSGGTLSITGEIASLGLSGSLLEGSLTAFGFQPAGGDPLEFLFDVTGGTAASLFGPQVGVIMSDTNFIGSFEQAFSSNGFAIADVAPAPIPEPGALFLFLAGAAVVAYSLRGRAEPIAR